jgi:hypothetical protein
MRIGWPYYKVDMYLGRRVARLAYVCEKTDRHFLLPDFMELSREYGRGHGVLPFELQCKESSCDCPADNKGMQCVTKRCDGILTLRMDVEERPL